MFCSPKLCVNKCYLSFSFRWVFPSHMLSVSCCSPVTLNGWLVPLPLYLRPGAYFCLWKNPVSCCILLPRISFVLIVSIPLYLLDGAYFCLWEAMPYVLPIIIWEITCITIPSLLSSRLRHPPSFNETYTLHERPILRYVHHLRHPPPFISLLRYHSSISSLLFITFITPFL